MIGLSAAFFTTAANVPQAIKVIKTGSTKSLAASTYMMLLAGGILWVIYGVMRDDTPVILANSIAGTLCGIILFMKLMALYKDRKTAK
ncbi:MAG: hypothetical protein EOO45_14990 [Flavobacterium sp.]|nr:MAG: hypothetical protein EOO45_24085 [Flavobacterium sp.]RZJ68162.1 MAG: hypothetical protein EOO45_14990 [Flavobacterium sp.]